MSIITEQKQPVAASASSRSIRAKSTRVTQSDTSSFVINPILEETGIVVANTNVNNLGRTLYASRSSAIQGYAALRVVVPTVGFAVYFIGGRVLKRLLLKMGTAAAAQAGVQAAKVAAPSKFASMAQWAASKIARAGDTVRKAGFIGRAVDWGATSIAVVCSISDIISWYYDALTDFAASHHFMFNEAYTRDDQARLNLLLKAGKVANSTKRSYYARITLTPKQVKGFLMLSSEVVTDQPFDIDVAMPMAAAWTAANGDGTSRTKTGDGDLVVTVFVADPADGSEKGAAAALAEAKVLLMRLTRALDQFADADYENLLVPMLLYVTRLSFVPGVISKVGPGFIAGADAILSTSFEAETDAIQSDMTEGSFTNASWIDSAADFLNRLFDTVTGGTADGSAE